MSTEENTQMLEKAYETGYDIGYLRAINETMQYIVDNQSCSVENILEFLFKASDNVKVPEDEAENYAKLCQ